MNLVDKINFERVIDSAILAKGEKGLAGIASSAQLRPWIMSGLYLGSDAAAVFLSWILAYFLRDLAGGVLLPELYIELWPFVFLFLLAYAATGLYPAVGVPPVEEIRQTTIATTISFHDVGGVDLPLPFRICILPQRLFESTMTKKRTKIMFLNHLKALYSHRKHIRTTNLIERSFVEEKRRTKVIPGFFTEKSALKLVFSSLIRAAKRWRKVTFTKVELALSGQAQG